MNGYCCNHGQGYHYEPGYPSMGSYQVRVQCPYCLNEFDANVYMDNNMGMGYQQNLGYAENPYANISPMEYGYDNIYPVSNNVFPAHYNNYGYIYPEENIHSPWDNNRMYTPNENPLPNSNHLN
ncbi:MAG TPA: hypothetical protein VIL05_10085 [Thermoclostridium sp.]